MATDGRHRHAPRRAALAALCALLASGCGESARVADAGPGVDVPPAEPAAPGEATLIGSPLAVARPTVVAVTHDDAGAPVLQTDLGNWRGALSHLAGTAHYDRGEWIYEDYPWTAFGAAQFPLPAVYQTLDALGLIYQPAQRLPGGLAVAISQVGAGPHVDEADLSELRFALHGDELHVLARTTTMLAPVRTALLLLFDTGRAGERLAVPFGAGITTRSADTAVLVTASGARIVDLISGAQTDAPATADPTAYLNVLAARLPLALLSAPASDVIRFVAAAGVVAPGSHEFDAGGAGGPLAKVVPRFDEPVQANYERLQALTLAGGNIDRFMTEVSITRMRAGDSERLVPGVGYSVATFEAPAENSSEGGTNGVLRQYGLYRPQSAGASPAPATLLFRGSSMTAHALAAVTPGLFRNLGDDNGAVVISPCGRSGFDSFQGAVYVDVLKTLDDAQARLALDPERLTVAGYSMGGYATYMFVATQPDRFAGAFVVAGLVGGNQPATSLLRFPDVLPMLENFYHVPVEIFQGDVDVNVPISNALAAVERLRSLGYRYRFNLLLANTHFSPGIQNDYSIGARYLRETRRAATPSRVRFIRSLEYERAIDTGAFTDQPARGQSVGLRFADAWFVHDLEPADPLLGTATVDVRSLAIPEALPEPRLRSGVDVGPLLGQAATPFVEQSWREQAAPAAPENRFEARLSGAGSLRLDLSAMALDVDEPLRASIVTDAASRVALDLGRSTCVDVVDGEASSQRFDAVERVVLELSAGAHELRVAQCSAGGQAE